MNNFKAALRLFYSAKAITKITLVGNLNTQRKFGSHHWNLRKKLYKMGLKYFF